MAHKYKIGDRIQVGPRGLSNVTKAANKAGTVTRLPDGCSPYRVRLDELVLNDSGYDPSTFSGSANGSWAFHEDMVSPILNPELDAALKQIDDLKFQLERVKKELDQAAREVAEMRPKTAPKRGDMQATPTGWQRWNGLEWRDA